MKQSCHCFWALDKHFYLVVVFFHTEPECSLKTLLITVLQIATTTRSQWASRTPQCLFQILFNFALEYPGYGSATSRRLHFFPQEVNPFQLKKRANGIILEFCIMDPSTVTYCLVKLFG